MRRTSQPKMATIPAVTQQYGDFVFRSQQIRHIIGAILEMLLVVINKGCQQVISSLLAVDVGFKDTKTADI